MIATRTLPVLTARHGEGVVWDGARNLLLCVDIPEGRVIEADPTSGAVRSVVVPGTVGAVHPTRDPDTCVIADSDGIALLRGGTVVPLARPLAARPDIRMNDAGVDPAGRYLAGSMALDATPGAACLYRLDLDGTLQTVLTGVTVSNGIDWSSDGGRCFYVDSPLRRVDVFDYDVATGQMAGRRTFADTSDLPGIPDGLTVDAEGGVWVAFYGGGRICRFAPDGRLDVTVELPVRKVTSCCFGGPDLTDLYISTSTEGFTAADHREQPDAGGIFHAVPGHRGRPATPFAGPEAPPR